MREFRITFAQCDSSGLVRPDIANALGARIATAYGGFTRFDAQGGYVMTDGRLVCESVFVFDVATDSAVESVLSFATIAAAEIRRAMNQESVYFRNIDGMVYILMDQAKPPARATAWKSFAEIDREYSNGRPDDKPPETLLDRAAKIRTIAESMASADSRRGGGGYDATAILAAAFDMES